MDVGVNVLIVVWFSIRSEAATSSSLSSLKETGEKVRPK